MKEKKKIKMSVSTRVEQSAYEVLEKAAAKHGEKVSWIVAKVLEDYAEWLQKQKNW